ncbi:hypothetical protein V6N11_016189 [Hibiscus sabdariffa]|uniref:Uncharacterized protein n=1 Tax=Hibiscus sabdariffa TaxID=183260 RepID=A0ABR2TU88_9ROSI
MLKRGSMSVHFFTNSTLLVSWFRSRRRQGSTVRLGNKGKRRGLWLRLRPVVQWRITVGPVRMLKKFILEITVKEKFIESYHLYLSLLRPQLFPLC